MWPCICIFMGMIPSCIWIWLISGIHWQGAISVWIWKLNVTVHTLHLSATEKDWINLMSCKNKKKKWEKQHAYWIYMHICPTIWSGRTPSHLELVRFAGQIRRKSFHHNAFIHLVVWGLTRGGYIEYGLLFLVKQHSDHLISMSVQCICV